jgi:hypothetical protein
MNLLQEALACPQCILSVMGAHAGEGVSAIFQRKIADIERTGRTFWLINSQKARPAQVQGHCGSSPAYTIFIEPATRGGARPATSADAAKEYSHDRALWSSLPEGTSPVTGKLGGAAALVFDKITPIVERTLDLWEYGEVSETPTPVKFKLGYSTVCAVRNDTKAHPERMKSHFRRIVAVARLADPYCVWVR